MHQSRLRNRARELGRPRKRVPRRRVTRPDNVPTTTTTTTYLFWNGMLVPILLAAGFSPSDPKLTFSFIEHRPSPQKFQVSECTTDPPNGACGAEPKCIGGVTECKTNPVDTAKVKRWLPVHEGRTPDLLTTSLHVCEPEQPASAYSLYSQPSCIAIQPPSANQLRGHILARLAASSSPTTRRRVTMPCATRAR